MKYLWNKTTGIIMGIVAIAVAVLTFLAGRRGANSERSKVADERLDDVSTKNSELETKKSKVVALNAEQSAGIIKHTEKAEVVSIQAGNDIKKHKEDSSKDSIDDAIDRW